MLPLRLVIDTNILVSGLISPGGLERAVLTFALTPPAQWFLSSEIANEYKDVLPRPKLKIKRAQRIVLESLIKQRSVVVMPAVKVSVCADPKDNKFLECAEAARADYLITGNKKHFPKFWKNTKIINAREFIEAVALHLGN